MCDDALASYLAGLFDGEGSVAISVTKRGGMTCMLCIVNAHLGVLELVRDTFGGSISKRKSRANTDTQVYVIQLCGANAERFCRAIVPFSIIKKRQLDLFVEARKLVCPPGGRRRKIGYVRQLEREAVAAESRRLKKVFA